MDPAAPATNDVARATVRFVCNEVIAATAPTLNMLLNNGQRRGESRKRAKLRPDRMYQARTAVPAT